jgi:hypothetical protein
MCLSGEMHQLSAAQWEFVQQAIARYSELAPLIRAGRWRRFGAMGQSYQHLTGWQAAVCTANDHALVVWHAFENPPARAAIAIGPASPSPRLTELGDISCNPGLAGGKLVWNLGRAWSGGVIVVQA